MCEIFASLFFVTFLICPSFQTSLNSSTTPANLIGTLVTKTSSQIPISDQTNSTVETSNPLNTSDFEKSFLVNISTAPNNFVENNGTSIVSNTVHSNSSKSSTLSINEIANSTLINQPTMSSHASITSSTFDAVVEPVFLTHATSIANSGDVKNTTILLENNTFSPLESTSMQTHTSKFEPTLDLETTQYAVTQPDKTTETSSYSFRAGTTLGTDSMTETVIENGSMRNTTATKNHKTGLSSSKGAIELNPGTVIMTTSKSALLSNQTNSLEAALSTATMSVASDNNFTAIPNHVAASTSQNTIDNNGITNSVAENSSYVATPLNTVRGVRATESSPLSNSSSWTKLVLSSKPYVVSTTSNYSTLPDKSTQESKSRNRKPPGFLNATLPTQPVVTFDTTGKFGNGTSTSVDSALSSSVKTSVMSIVPKTKATTTTSAKIEIAVGKKYGWGKIIGLLSVVAFLLLLLICCVHKCRYRQKYKKIRNLEIYDEGDFLFSSKGKKGKYQSDRHGLLDDSSEDDLY